MKIGIDQEKLHKASHVLRSMCRIDPRGGMLAQPHLSKVLKAMLSHEELKPLLMAQNEQVAGATTDDLRGDMRVAGLQAASHVLSFAAVLRSDKQQGGEPCSGTTVRGDVCSQHREGSTSYEATGSFAAQAMPLHPL